MRVHSDTAWAIANQYSYTLASDTRTLASQIDDAIDAARADEREKTSDEIAVYVEGPKARKAKMKWGNLNRPSRKSGQSSAALSMRRQLAENIRSRFGSTKDTANG